MCQPSQTSSSSASSRLFAMMRVISFRSRQPSLLSSPLLGAVCGQYLPLPYMPSIALLMRVNSSASFSFEGAGKVSESFSSFILRSMILRQRHARRTLPLPSRVRRLPRSRSGSTGGQDLTVVNDVGRSNPVDPSRRRLSESADASLPFRSTAGVSNGRFRRGFSDDGFRSRCTRLRRGDRGRSRSAGDGGSDRLRRCCGRRCRSWFSGRGRLCLRKHAHHKAYNEYESHPETIMAKLMPGLAPLETGYTNRMGNLVIGMALALAALAPTAAPPKQQFFIRIEPTRPTFSQDATKEENKIVAEHFSYLKKLAGEGTVVLAGPSINGAKTFGVIIVEVPKRSRGEGDTRSRSSLQSWYMEGRGVAVHDIPPA